MKMSPTMTLLIDFAAPPFASRWRAFLFYAAAAAPLFMRFRRHAITSRFTPLCAARRCLSKLNQRTDDYLRAAFSPDARWYYYYAARAARAFRQRRIIIIYYCFIVSRFHDFIDAIIILLTPKNTAATQRHAPRRFTLPYARMRTYD